MPEPNQRQAQAKPQEPRGAGSGENANATRSRNLVEWPPEPIPHAQAVDALEEERDAQAEFNNDMHEIQTKGAIEFKNRLLDAATIDNDKVREEARDAYLAQSDPEEKKRRLKGEMDARAKRDKAQVESAGKR